MNKEARRERREQRREDRQEAFWQSVPSVDGADVADILGEKIFEDFLDATVAVAGGTAAELSTKLLPEEIVFCGQVASHATEIRAMADHGSPFDE